MGEKKSKTVSPAVKLFSQLSKKMVQALYEKYRVDFEMFEYGISEYVRYASDSDGLMPDAINAVIADNNKDDDEVISATLNP